MKHAVKHLWFPEAAIETIAESRQAARQMLGTDAMVDAQDIAFCIGDQGVDPRQDLGRLLPRTGRQPLMAENGRSVKEAIPSANFVLSCRPRDEMATKRGSFLGLRPERKVVKRVFECGGSDCCII